MRKSLGILKADGSYDAKVVGQELFDRLNDGRKVSGVRFNANDIASLVELSNCINNMSEYDQRLFDLPIEEVLFPKCFEFLIRPLKVSISPDDRSENLIPHYKTQKYDYNPEVVSSICENIYGAYKDSAKYVTIDRKVGTLNDQKSWTTLEDGVWKLNIGSDEQVWPVPLLGLGNLFKASYFNETADVAMSNTLLKWRMKEEPKTK